MYTEEEQLFIKLYDDGEFDWEEFPEERYTFNSIQKDQYGCDGYIDVEEVFKIKDRYFRVGYILGGKDLDECFDLGYPEEVFPYEVTRIEFR